MSTRSLLTASLLACLLGCPASEEMPTGDQMPSMGGLRFEEQDTYDVMAGGRASLAVRLVDMNGEPVADEVVEFGLTGSPEGASLEVASTVTDAEGIARTVLYAGRASTPFRVRATVDGLAPLYFNITVSAAAAPSVDVSIAYAGARDISANTVVIVEGMSCDQVRSNPSDVRMSLAVPADKPQLTFNPGAGRSYAIAAWGSDESNSKLAWGCRQYTARVSEEETSEPLVVTLEDIPFTAAAPVPLSFTLNLQPLLTELAPAARSAVSTALPATSTPQASFLLDLIQAKVNIADVRLSENLDAALQQLLDAASAGPLLFAEGLAAEVSKDGASCMLQGALTPVDARNMMMSSLTISSPVYALPADSLAKDLNLGAEALKGVLEFRGSYVQSEAQVSVSALKIGLGFGSYATYLSLLVAEQRDRYRGRMGCTELETLVTQRTASFAGITPSEAAMECARAYEDLFVRIRERWTALDQQRNTISVGPSTLSAHDRDGDRAIDDMGPAKLTGSWGTAAGTDAGMALEINVRTPAAVNVR